MNTALRLAGICGLSLFAACTGADNAGEPSSTPIDSTNVHGTAPVEYNNDTSKALLPEEPTEGNRANTPGGDSVPSGRK